MKRGKYYVAPHSASDGVVAYILHRYALSAAPVFDPADTKVTRETLLAKIKDTILGTADLKGTCSRPTETDAANPDANSGGAEQPKSKKPRAE